MTTALINQLVSATDKTETGALDNKTNGHTATYTETVTHLANGTVDKLVTVTNGTGATSSRDTVYTAVSDTLVTSHTTATERDGKSVTIDRTYTLNGDGTISLTAHRVVAGGVTDDVTATITKTSTGFTETGTITFSNGKTGTFTATDTHGADAFEYIDTAQIIGVHGGVHTHTTDITGTHS